jgi:flagellar basal-body rod protein FlgF
MIYGLYLSAAGVMSSSYRQDVIANNLANTETVGFKRDLPLFQERLTEAQQRRGERWSDPLMEGLGGGLLASPTLVDNRQGDMEHTGAPLDMAIQGEGFFAVDDHGETRLTRNGRFMINRDGELSLSDMPGHKVLGADGKPIHLPPGGNVSVDANGTLTRDGQAVGRVGVFDVPHRDQLVKLGGTLLSYPDRAEIKPTEATIRGETVERSNVDPTTEMAELIEAQRQLEANANMIRYQDQTLQLLCNNVGKIG